MASKKRIHPIVRPTDGIAGATKEWRSSKPVLEVVKCTKCGLCWLYCPDECIEINEDGYPEIVDVYCKGCMICAAVCPVGALEEQPEGEEEVIDVYVTK